MSDRLIAAVETALSKLAQELHHDASVLVQYAAGDWAELKNALAEAKGESPSAAPEPVVAPSPGDSSPAPADPVVSTTENQP